MEPNSAKLAKGRGATVSPTNRFEPVRIESDWEQLAADDEQFTESPRVATLFSADSSRSIIAKNDSPDVPFTYSVNAYRGCEHGCAYCYARPYHEYLGMNAGLDFESKILVKFDAAELLREELSHPKWTGELIMMSGVTDCYQPAERNFKLTRSLLEVMNETNQPTAMITKNALVLRDVDLLAPMAERNLAAVAISITTLDAELARKLEPRTSSPEARLRTIRALSDAGIPVRAMIAPIVPGLNDHEIPKLLEAVKDAGAIGAGYVLLRLPHAVAPIFTAWVAEHRPLALPRIEGLIRSTRGGELYRSKPGERMRGTGTYAAQIKTTFDVFAKKLGLNERWKGLDSTQFRPPKLPGGQGLLF